MAYWKRYSNSGSRSTLTRSVGEDDLDSNYFTDDELANTDRVTPFAEPIHPSLYDWKNIDVKSTATYNRSTSLHLDQLKKPEMNGNYKSWNKMPSTSTDLSSKNFDVIDTSNGFTEKRMLQAQKNEKYSKNTKKNLISSVKLIVVFMCVIIGVVGMVLFITIFQKRGDVHGPPEDLTSQDTLSCTLSSTVDGYVRFNNPLDITCSVPEVIDLTNRTYSVRITFTSVYSYLQGNDSDTDTNLTSSHSTDGRWNITIQEKNLHLRRSPVKCDSGGVYAIYFKEDNIETGPTNVSVKVLSETSQVSLYVGKRSNTSEFYDIACSARSGCTPVPILLMGTIGDQTIPLLGSNFDCLIKFSEIEGWSANCSGTMPQNILKSFNDILCRPITGNSTTDEASESKISKKKYLCETEDCVFHCPAEDGDQFYLDPTDCTIFHRCVDQRLYTRPCGKSTYFNTKTCACDHVDKVEGCDDKGFRPPNAYSIKRKCEK